MHGSAATKVVVEMPHDAWTKLRAILRDRLSPELFERWFEPLKASSVEGDRVEVAAPDTFHRDFVDEHYGALFAESLPVLLGRSVELTFVVKEGTRPSDIEPVARAARLRTFLPNPRYSFDTFVVGDSNRLAFAAARAVAERPGGSYNPLFIHGSYGVGKTHLLNAIANVLMKEAYRSIVFASYETYANDYLEARANDSVSEFRRKYHGCDALLIDDVQFLGSRDAPTSEFLNVFDALHARGAQIVLSSDRGPKELSGIDDRLRSRLEWGMRVEVRAPEFETRAAILARKAAAEKIELPDRVAALLATHIDSSVRELEGALARLSAFASLSAKPITETLARDVLADVIPQGFTENAPATSPLMAHESVAGSAAWIHRELPSHAVAGLHAPDSGRIDARRVAAFFGVSRAVLAKILKRSPQALHKAPAAQSIQVQLGVLERIAASLLSLFGTEENARVWLNAPNPDLDGVAPLDLVKKNRAVVVAELLEDALLGHPG